MGAIAMGMRSRFADGGAPGDAPPAANPAFVDLLARLNGQGAPAGPPQPAVNAGVAGGGQDQLPSGPMQGAVGDQPVDPEAAAKLDRIRTAQAVLQAGGVGAPSQQPGAINLPLLAAAGAFLAPTRTGGFAESLGNAMTQGANAVHQQRQQDEQARLRQYQQQELAAYRQGMLGVRQQDADTREMSAQAKDFIARRTLELRASGMSDLAAYRQATIDAKLLGIDAANDRAQLRADTVRYGADTRAATEQAKLDQQRVRWMQSDAAKAEDQRLRRLGIDSRLANSALLAASRDIQVITGKKPAQQAVDEWFRAQQSTMGRLQPPATGGAPAAAQPAPPAPGAAPAAPAQSQLRAPTANEIAGAKAAIARDPANRAIVLDRLRAAGVNTEGL